VNTNNKVSTKHAFFFALPSLVSGILERPAFYIIPSIYAKYYNLDLATIGTILFIARIFDVITDPLIGFLSDKTKTAIGSRKPWLIPGTLITSISVYYLFNPIGEVSAFYFAIWFLTLFIGWTMLEIPMAAWQTELTSDYDDRTRVISYRTIFNLSGGLLFAVFPLLPMFSSTEFNPEVMANIGVLIVVVLPIVVLSAIYIVPHKQVSKKSSVSEPLTDVLKSIAKNKPMQIYLVCFLFTGIGFGALNSLVFLFSDTYLLIGDKFTWILITISVANVIAVPIWNRLFNIWQRHHGWAIGVLIAIASVFFTVFLTPNEFSFYGMLIIALVYGISIPAYYIAAPALISDIVDYEQFKTGQNRAGQFNSIHYFTMKLNNAIGGAVAFWVLAIFNYQAKETVHTTEEIIGLKLSMTGIPLILIIISALIIWHFPLSKKKQTTISKYNARKQ